MDIYILRDGKEIGPFSEEATGTLLQDGSIREVDLAWHSGLPKWIPLADVLNPATPALETPPPPPPAAAETPRPSLSPAGDLPKAGESATEKQKALLGYLGMVHPPDISKDQAALLVNDAMEDAKNATRLAQWNNDRLKLHPDLFAAEIQAKKDGRASDFFEICQTGGAEYFTKITKAHCQVLVGYLDVKFPNWDTDEKEAAQKYFYPAVAEKFPQLVAKQWKGKLLYATGPKVAAELSRQRPATGKLRKRKSTAGRPLAAVGRGLVFGGLILAMFYFVQKVFKAPASGEKAPAGEAANPTSNTLTPIPAPVKPEAFPPIEPEKMAAQADAGAAIIDPANPAIPAPISLLPADPLMAANPASPVAAANPLDPAMAAHPPDPDMAADPAAPKPAAPLPGFPPDPPVVAGSLFNPDPATPVKPAPVPDPVAPVAPAAVPAAPVDPAAAPRINLKLTKPVEVQLAYGKMKLPVGTPVKLVSREGNAVKVNYLNTVLTVPANFTDIGDAVAAPATAPAPLAPAPATAPAPAPTPASDL